MFYQLSDPTQNVPEGYEGWIEQLKQEKIICDCWNIIKHKPIEVFLNEIIKKSIFNNTKESKQAYYVKITNDKVGGIPCFALPYASNGWYHEMYEPADLVEKIDEHLNREHCSDKDKRFLQVLRDSIDEEGNNMMFIGRLLNKE